MFKVPVEIRTLELAESSVNKPAPLLIPESHLLSLPPES